MRDSGRTSLAVVRVRHGRRRSKPMPIASVRDFRGLMTRPAMRNLGSTVRPHARRSRNARPAAWRKLRVELAPRTRSRNAGAVWGRPPRAPAKLHAPFAPILRTSTRPWVRQGSGKRQWPQSPPWRARLQEESREESTLPSFRSPGLRRACWSRRPTRAPTRPTGSAVNERCARGCGLRLDRTFAVALDGRW